MLSFSLNARMIKELDHYASSSCKQIGSSFEIKNNELLKKKKTKFELRLAKS